ncbi:MAG: autoinducer binding domain-containing protein [Octadecabacter sp.]|nr:autoinducer binding domain-containing protein [Octadecabacter sp.]
MVDIGKIKMLLESVEKLAVSGSAIAFHIKLTSPELMFQTYPKAWTDTYSEKGFVMVDPIVRWGFTETGSIRWSELSKQDEQNILMQSAAYGMTYGVAISVESDSSRSMAGYSRPDREYTDAEIAQLSKCTQSLHDLTASRESMDAALREELSQLAAKFAR